MMRTIIKIILLLPLTAMYCQKDELAEPFLNKISNELSDGEKAVSIAFKYVREDLQENSKLEGEGSLVLFGEKYKMDLGSAIVFFDGEKQYSLNTEVEEVYVSVPDPENKEFTFSDPFGLLKNYKKEFKYRLVGEASVNETPAEEIQLYPENIEGTYSLFKLFFSQKNKDLLAIIVRRKEGILYTMDRIEMRKIDDPGLDYFKFNQDEYPNVEVIELMD